MNKVFMNNSRIELRENHYLKSDGDNGVVLVYHQIRERINKKTEKVEDFLFESKTYHTRVAQALREYVKQSLNTSKTFEEIIEKEDKIYSLISDLDKTFKQFN